MPQKYSLTSHLEVIQGNADLFGEQRSSKVSVPTQSATTSVKSGASTQCLSAFPLATLPNCLTDDCSGPGKERHLSERSKRKPRSFNKSKQLGPCCILIGHYPQTNRRELCWPDDLSLHLPCVFLALSPCGSTARATAVLPATRVGSTFSLRFWKSVLI